MNKKILLFLGLSLGLGKIASGQEVEDLARYSGKIYQGTARSTGAGNAFGAVGADYGAIGINPAGLGFYRKSEFMFTAAFDETSTNNSYLGSIAGDKKDNFNIGNVGLVGANPRFKDGKEVQDGWVSVNWALGMNRTNNYHANTVIQGDNFNNSILFSYRDNAYNQNQKPSGLFYGSRGLLAYKTFLIDPLATDSTIYQPATRHDNKINVTQRDILNTSGATNDINLTFAGNYSNRLYIGGAVSVPLVRYNSVRTFTEINKNPPAATTDQYMGSEEIDSLNTSGVGITASLGAIYRFSDFFRAGLSFQLPTLYSLTDLYSTSITGSTRYNGTMSAWGGNTNSGGYSYTIVTPARITASAAFFFNKNGFLSADYEYVDYSSARINSNTSTFFDVNQAAMKTMTAVSTVRIGAEYRISQFAVRAGYNYISSPYKASYTVAGYTNDFNIYSLGVGFRDKNSSFDLTYQLLQNNSTYTPYTLSDGSEASAGISASRSNLMLTYSSRF